MTAPARRPAALAAYGSRLRVVPGDITNRSSVAPAVAGHEAVLSALGSHTLRPSTVLSTGIDYTPDAMREHRVRALVCMSALGVGETRGQLGPVYNLLLTPCSCATASLTRSASRPGFARARRSGPLCARAR